MTVSGIVGRRLHAGYSRNVGAPRFDHFRIVAIIASCKHYGVGADVLDVFSFLVLCDYSVYASRFITHKLLCAVVENNILSILGQLLHKNVKFVRKVSEGGIIRTP